MRRNRKLPILVIAVLIVLASTLAMRKEVAAQPQAAVTTNDLLALVNGLRTTNGLPALTVNSILMSTAQSTAQQMADQNLSWHIGSTSDRIKAAGYGGSATVWATENFAVGHDVSIEWIQAVWADEWHMIPMKNPIYCDVGAGMATAEDGSVYYIVHAAYTSSRYCGEYIGPGGITLPTIQAQTKQAGGATPEAVPTEVASNWIEPVITVTPNAHGELVHEVKYGQYLWLIADTYGTSVDVIKELNGMWWDSIYVGNHLLIPTPEWYALTPTITKTPTGQAVDPVILATQSTEEAKFTPTPTFTRTAPPGQSPTNPIAPDEKDSPPPEETNMGSMILVVFGISAVVILITFLQPWKPKSEPEQEDPLNTRVE